MSTTVYSTQLELELGINYAPAIVREHGLRDAHLRPLVARHKGQSFRVHAREAWGYPSLELRAGNSWPAVTLDCDLPTVVDALHSLKSTFPLPVPNMVVERQYNGHCHASWFLSRPVHRGESARAAPLRKLARITEFYRQTLEADAGYATACLTHNPLEETHRAGEFRTHWGHKCGRSLGELSEVISEAAGACRYTADHGSGPELFALFVGLMKWAGSPFEPGAARSWPWRGPRMTAWTIAARRISEVSGDFPKSVERYRDGWIAQGRVYTKAERTAWGQFPGPAKRCGATCGQCSPRLPNHRGTRGGLDSLRVNLGQAVQDVAKRRLESATARG